MKDLLVQFHPIRCSGSLQESDQARLDEKSALAKMSLQIVTDVGDNLAMHVMFVLLISLGQLPSPCMARHMVCCSVLQTLSAASV